jgi:hypothetical protein
MVDQHHSRNNKASNEMLRPQWFWVVSVSLVLIGLWGFPPVWYTRSAKLGDQYWFSPSQEVEGYRFVDQPIGEALERQLVADETFNGVFTDDAWQPVLAFMAKRYTESMNEIGLFVHTPDRCWTEGGWKIQPIEPDYVEMELAGQPLGFERRLFVNGSRYELVYFLGLVGGQTLPYRLDHNLSVAMKYQLNPELEHSSGTSYRLIDQKLWGRVFDAFKSRRPLLGPKQFVRVSTQIEPSYLEEGDQILQKFLQKWLIRKGYKEELAAWSARRVDATSSTESSVD